MQTRSVIHTLLIVFFYLLVFYFSYTLIDESYGEHFALAFSMFYLVFVLFSFEKIKTMVGMVTGQKTHVKEFELFSTILGLNKKMQSQLTAEEVFKSLDEVLKAAFRTGPVSVLVDVSLCMGDSTKEFNIDYPQSRAVMLWQPGNDLNVFRKGEIKHIFSSREVTLSEDATASDRALMNEFNAGLAVPVLQNGDLLAVLLLHGVHRNLSLSAFELKMLSVLADQLALVLDRVRIYTQVMQKKALDHAEKMKVMQTLSANIAHEMRTPLSGVRANISGIETYLPGMLKAYEKVARENPDEYPPIREGHVNTIRSTPDRVCLMIDQANAVIDMLLMNLRNTSQDQQHLSYCNAGELIEQAVDRYPFKTGEKEMLSMDLKEDFRFKGVESFFIYVLFNLIKNSLYAIRSAQKGDISITLRQGENENYICFRDTGEGIEQKVISRIFDGFFTTKDDGTGAGLAFCKRTIRSFGGDIECVSVYGDYTEFVISFPKINEILH